MTIPSEKSLIIPLTVPNLRGNEGKYLQECVNTNYVSSVGPFVTKFEEQVCEATQSSYAVATCSGTSSLHVALKTVGVKENELVITPSFTFIATANAIKYCGADPWLFDISPENWGLDPYLLEEILKEETSQSEKGLIHKNSGKRIAAILPVYAVGIPAEMNKIIEIAKQYDLPIVLDSAGAIGSKYKQKEIGELAINIAILSFNGNKLVTTGGGGCILTNDAPLAQKIRHLATTARFNDRYVHDDIGFNYRITNLEAAVGCAQLEQLPEFIARKKYIADAYKKLAVQFKDLSTFPEPKHTTPNHWLSGLVLPEKKKVSELLAQLHSFNIQARPFWIPLHKQVSYKNCYRTKQDYVESLYEKIIILPCSTGLTEIELDYVVKNVKLSLKNIKCL